MSTDSDMPLSAHLLELRKRLLRFIIVLGIAFVAGMPFNEYIYTYLSNPLMASLPTDGKLIATQVTSPVLVYKNNLLCCFVILHARVFHRIMGVLEAWIIRA